MNTRLVLTLVWLLVWSPRLEASNPVTSSGGQNRVGCEEVAVQTILLEARGEAHQGQTSIGEVLRTRARQRGTTPCQEALRPYQFSAWNNPAVAHKVLRRATANEWEIGRAAGAGSPHSENSRGPTP